MSGRLPKVKRKKFENLLEDNGFHMDRCNGGHAIWKRTQSVSVPIHDNEVNGGMVRKYTKLYNLKEGKENKCLKNQ